SRNTLPRMNPVANINIIKGAGIGRPVSKRYIIPRATVIIVKDIPTTTAIICKKCLSKDL
ncbi:MAG TPA: hypothetical protein VMW20_06855, partial [Candidatus Nanoarchaeia archaeon]|nr:hypothetical protein [Candidatus Nanoarchaeia archaeon]